MRCAQATTSAWCASTTPWAPFIDPPISVVAQPYRIGAQAAELLVERIRGDGTAPRRIVLGTDLITRISSLPPRSPDAEMARALRSAVCNRPGPTVNSSSHR